MWRGMPSWNCFQIHTSMAMSLSDVHLVGTWVPIQSSNIPIDLINLMNYIKIYFYRIGPFNQLPCELMKFHQELGWLMVNNPINWVIIKLTLKWWNNQNNYKAFPIIQIILYLYFDLGLDGICHHDFLFLIVKLG